MPEKVVDNQYPVYNLLRHHWISQAFTSRTVEPKKLLILLEAARCAPSSYNEQPWSFILTTKNNPDEYKRLFSCLVAANSWAQQASVLMLFVAKLHFDRNGKTNRHAFHDVGLATENLVIQAMALDLFAHQMAGFDVDKVRELFNIPEGHEPVTAIALGYLGEPQTLPENLRERELAPRTRKPLETFVFAERWGQPSPLATNLVERKNL